VALSAKQAAISIIERMPDDASFDDILYALYVRQRVERSLRNAESGNIIDHDDMKRDIAAWRESVGRKMRAATTGTSSGS
jgi:hypothetical protein